MYKTIKIANKRTSNIVVISIILLTTMLLVTCCKSKAVGPTPLESFREYKKEKIEVLDKMLQEGKISKEAYKLNIDNLNEYEKSLKK